MAGHYPGLAPGACIYTRRSDLFSITSRFSPRGLFLDMANGCFTGSLVQDTAPGIHNLALAALLQHCSKAVDTGTVSLHIQCFGDTAKWWNVFQNFMGHSHFHHGLMQPSALLAEAYMPLECICELKPVTVRTYLWFLRSPLSVNLEMSGDLTDVREMSRIGPEVRSVSEKLLRVILLTANFIFGAILVFSGITHDMDN